MKHYCNNKIHQIFHFFLTDEPRNTKKVVRTDKSRRRISPSPLRMSRAASPTSRHSPISTEGKVYFDRDEQLTRERHRGRQGDIGQGKVYQDYSYEPSLQHSDQEFMHNPEPAARHHRYEYEGRPSLSIS